MDKVHILYIDCLFIVHGQARPMQVQECFSLSRSKASRLFSAYRDLVSSSVLFDSSSKTYKTTSDYESLSGRNREQALWYIENVVRVFEDAEATVIEAKKKGSPLAG
ncbi:hypothetical protein AB6C40_23900 [Vibrio splendidus]